MISALHAGSDRRYLEISPSHKSIRCAQKATPRSSDLLFEEVRGLTEGFFAHPFHILGLSYNSRRSKRDLDIAIGKSEREDPSALRRVPIKTKLKKAWDRLATRKICRGPVPAVAEVQSRAG